MERLLVAIEDCEATTIVSPSMQQVLKLAGAFSGRVWLLHVVPPPGAAPYSVDSEMLREGSATELRHEHEYMQRLAQCLRDRGVDAKAIVVEGSTVDSIVDKARRLDADLIVVGCHRHGPVFGALLGAPGETLLGECPCPIMFVPEETGDQG